MPDLLRDKAVAEYLQNFPYRITVRAGYTWSPQFKEFADWCESNLGVKYKDWHLTQTSKSSYTLHMKSSKWSIFLALKFSNIIDSNQL